MRLPQPFRRHCHAATTPDKVLALRAPRPAAWWILPAALAVAGTVYAVAWWLLASLPAEPTPAQAAAAAARSEIIRTALAAGAGAGAAITLMLAFRRQRHQELVAHVTAEQTDRNAELAEKIADRNRHDATERRVTELYTKAGEQLGHDKAAVRLAGLYALERLAQDNPDHRQTIVNVICAYLRMPYTLPDRPGSGPASTAPPSAVASTDETRQDPRQEAEGERQVRLTAQTILVDHLRDHRPAGQSPGKPSGPRFWDGICIDLTGATLIDLDFTGCHTADARFRGATFQGNVGFDEATFQGQAAFVEATFQGSAGFLMAVFHGNTQFEDAVFYGDVWFSGAVFHGVTRFDRAAFQEGVDFEDAVFNRGSVGIGVTARPHKNHSWPGGWQVMAQPDGTGPSPAPPDPGQIDGSAD
jgi:hypothetical protein